MANELIKYEYDTDKGKVSLTAKTVRDHLVPADSKVTDQEIVMFLELCKYQKLNPYLREAYLVKYGNYAASIVTGKEVFTQRAQSDPSFAGFEAGVTIKMEDGALIRRDGSLLLTGERLVGGWAKVYIKGYAVPMFDEVSFAEYASKKADGGFTKMWTEKPATMIRKVALVHALREAFPDKFKGLYSQEEINTIDPSTLPTEPVIIPQVETAKVKAKDVTPPHETLIYKSPEPNSGDPMVGIEPDTFPEVLGGGQIPIQPPIKDAFEEATKGMDDPAGEQITFGKYMGKTIGEVGAVDRSYIEWLSRDAKNAALKKACGNYLIKYPKYAKPAAKAKAKQGRETWDTDLPEVVAPWEDGYVPPDAPPEG